MTFAWPSSVTITLPGFRSRWIEPFFMRAAEALRDLDGQIERPFRGQRTPNQDVAQPLAADQLHRDERHAVGGADLVDDRDVRMLDERRGACFLQHPLATNAIVDEIFRQDFEGDVAAEVEIAGAVDDAHAAAADFFDDFVVREPAADHSGRGQL